MISIGSGDRHICLWHNTPGQKELISDLEAKIPKTSSKPFKVCVEIGYIHAPINAEYFSVV